MAKIRNNKGFSLIELMVVVAIVAIMGTFAVPPMISWLQNKGLQSAARDLYSNMRKAQSMAVKNNRNCAISFDGLTPKGSLGYTVYVDDNPKDFVYTAGSEQIIARVLWSQYRNVQLANDVNFDDTSGKPTFSFQPNLIPTDKSGGFANGTVRLKNSIPRQLEVVVSISGNVSLK